MSELRQEVLQAEVAIRRLAEEMARAKGIADSVEEVRRQLNEAANLLERSRKAMEEVQVPLKEATETLNRFGRQLTQTIQDLSSNLRTDFEKQMNALMRQNEQLLRIITAQDAEIKRLSKLLAFSLAFSVAATLGIIIILALLFVRA